MHILRFEKCESLCLKLPEKSKVLDVLRSNSSKNAFCGFSVVPVPSGRMTVSARPYFEALDIFIAKFCGTNVIRALHVWHECCECIDPSATYA